MAETCKTMMAKPPSRFMFLIPAIVLIVLGVAVVIEPRILVWLIAVALVVMGVAMLMLARFMNVVAERFQGMHEG
jgi:uncharacterized membrane protein HdeD (DUF308 family)